jgi:hypothetical protein
VRGDVRRASTDALSSADDVATTARADVRRTATDARTAAEAIGSAAEAEARVRSTQVRQLAQRTVDVPVGAGLVARDTLVSTVQGLAETLSQRARMERELERYERRGARARNRFERRLTSTRRDVEREMRQRRSHVTRLVNDAQRRIGSTL